MADLPTPITHLSVSLSGHPTHSPEHQSFDEYEYNDGEINLDDIVEEYVNDGWTKIVIEVIV